MFSKRNFELIFPMEISILEEQTGIQEIGAALGPIIY